MLKKLFKNKKQNLLPTDKNDVTIHILDSETTLIHQALGLSEERRDFIHDKMSKYIETSRDKVVVTAFIEELSKELIHPNELFFAAYSLGNYAGQQAEMGRMLDTLKNFKL